MKVDVRLVHSRGTPPTLLCFRLARSLYRPEHALYLYCDHLVVGYLLLWAAESTTVVHGLIEQKLSHECLV